MAPSYQGYTGDPLKAIFLEEHGTIDVLKYGDFPEPALEPGQVRVRVLACSLNYHDVFTRRGMPGIKVPLPMLPGCDCAGELIEIAGDVAGWSVGGSLASLLALRRELYPIYGLPAGIVKACFATSAGFAYPSGDPAPGDSGITYGELMYETPEDDVLTAQVDYAKGNRVPFYISHGSEDFRHVMNSSAAMAAALRQADGAVTYDVFDGLDHYQTNLAHGERDDRWVATVHAWMKAPPKGGKSAPGTTTS